MAQIGRVYTARFSSVSITAAQDLVSLLPGASKMIVLHEVAIGQISTTSSQNIPISIKRMSGTLTAGSGGLVLTPQRLNSSDAAAVTTARQNDTSQATATTATILRSDVYNTVNTYLYMPAVDDRPIVGPNEQLVVSMDGVPSAAQITSVTVTFEELP